MTVNELIDKLANFPGDLEVSICDGDAGIVYEGEFAVHLFTDMHGVQFVDIGIGGCEVEED